MIVQWICHVVNKCIFSLISVFNQFYLILFNFIFCLFIIMRFYIYVMSAAWMYSRKTAPKHDLFHFRNDMSTARTLRSCLIGKMLMPKEICNLVHHCFKNTQTHRTTKKNDERYEVCLMKKDNGIEVSQVSHDVSQKSTV